MPPAARLLVAAALAELVVAAWAGWAMAVARVAPSMAWAHGLRALHTEAALVGAWTGLALGIAWWIFPRPGGKRRYAAVLLAGGALLHIGVWLAGGGIRAGQALAAVGLIVAAASLVGRLARPVAPAPHSR
jgi:hypothetical protein